MITTLQKDPVTSFLMEAIRETIDKALDEKFGLYLDKMTEAITPKTAPSHDDGCEGYTARETAQLLHVNLSTLWRWQKEGKLTPTKVGKKLFYRKEDVQRFINGEIQ